MANVIIIHVSCKTQAEAQEVQSRLMMHFGKRIIMQFVEGTLVFAIVRTLDPCLFGAYEGLFIYAKIVQEASPVTAQWRCELMESVTERRSTAV